MFLWFHVNVLLLCCVIINQTVGQRCSVTAKWWQHTHRTTCCWFHLFNMLFSSHHFRVMSLRRGCAIKCGVSFLTLWAWSCPVGFHDWDSSAFEHQDPNPPLFLYRCPLFPFSNGSYFSPKFGGKGWVLFFKPPFSISPFSPLPHSTTEGSLKGRLTMAAIFFYRGRTEE